MLMTLDHGMDFGPDEMQAMLVDAAQRFAQDVDSFAARRAEGGACIASVWQRLVEMGWTGIAAPESAGGFGGRPEDMAFLLLHCGTGVVAPMLVGNVIAPSQLLMALDGPAAQEWLARLVRGEAIFALAVDQGDFIAAGRMGVQAQDAPDGFVLAGCRTGIFAGVDCDTLLVPASFGGESAVFAVPADLPGVSLSRRVLVDGSLLFELELRQVTLPGESLLASGNVAEQAIGQAMDHGLIALCASAISCMERAITLSAAYLKMRRQFGKSLAEFQSLQHRVADLFIRTNDAKSILMAALSACGGEPGARARMASACKAKVMPLAELVTGEAIHLHGGIGFTREYEVGHLFQRAAVAQRLLGTSDDHITRYARLKS